MDGAVQPDVLAFPAATTARFLVLVAAMLAAGLFVGSAIYNTDVVAGSTWSTDIGSCAARSAAGSDDPAAQQAAFLDCAAFIERERAAFAVGMAAFLVLAALVVMFIAPAVIQRRHRLRWPWTGVARAVHRVRVLAFEMGLRTPPVVLLGSSRQHDAFCFGRPGRYRIVLPPGLAIREGTPVFDTVVRHELAHLVHRDVAWSWLANAIWYVLAPMLMLPVVLSLVSADFSVLADYLWRAVLLAVAVHLARRALLRSREHDADLRSVRGGGVPAMTDVLASIRPKPRRRVLATHPDPAARLDVVAHPERVVSVTAAHGFTVSFFAALALPLLGNLFVSASLASPLLSVARLVVAALVAPLLGATLGLALWRQAAFGRLTGAPVRVVPVTFGVFVGWAAGESASFAGTALDTLETFWVPLPAALVLAGATAVVSGLGELWEQAGGRLRQPRANWIPAIVLSTVLFGVALWVGSQLQVALGSGGWDFASALVSAWMRSPVFALVALVFAVVVACMHRLARRTTTTSAWLALPRRRPPADPRAAHVVVVGAVAGLAGVAVLVGFRHWTALPIGPVEQERLFNTYLWVAGAVAATAALLVGVLFGAAGRGTALLAGPAATTVVGLGLLVINTARGGALTVGFAAYCLASVLAAGFLVSMATAWLVLPSVRRTGPSWLVVIAVSAVLAAGSACGVVAGRAALVRTALSVADDASWVVEEAVRDYKTRLVPEILQGRAAVDEALSRLDADRTLDLAARAARLRAEVIDPLRELVRETRTYQPPNDVVRDVHRHCLASLDSRIEGLDGYASAWETNDKDLIASARATLMASETEWQAWRRGVLSL